MSVTWTCAGMTRRRMLTRGATLSAAGVSVMAAACAPGETPAEPAGATPKESGTIQWIHWGTEAERVAAANRIIDSFVAQNPGLSVNLIVGPDPNGRLQTMVAGGTPPDIGATTPIWVA